MEDNTQRLQEVSFSLISRSSSTSKNYYLLQTLSVLLTNTFLCSSSAYCLIVSDLGHLEGHVPFYLDMFRPLLSHTQYLKGVEKGALRGLYKVKMVCLLYNCFFE